MTREEYEKLRVGDRVSYGYLQARRGTVTAIFDGEVYVTFDRQALDTRIINHNLLLREHPQSEIIFLENGLPIWYLDYCRSLTD